MKESATIMEEVSIISSERQEGGHLYNLLL